MAIKLTPRIFTRYLAAYPRMMAGRIKPAFRQRWKSSPIWHCSMQRLLVSLPPPAAGDIVTVALILPSPRAGCPALSGCIILWSSDFPLRRHGHQSGHPDLIFLKPDGPTHQPRYFAHAAHA